MSYLYIYVQITIAFVFVNAVKQYFKDVVAYLYAQIVLIQG